GRRSRIAQCHKVRSPPRCQPIGVRPYGDSVCDGTVEARIDDVALIAALEQIARLVGADAVGGQPVQDNVKGKAQATPLALDGYLMDRVFDRAAKSQAGVGLGKIADQQRIVTSREKGIEADMVEAQIGGPGQPLLPVTIAVEVVNIANARRLRLQTPTRLSHPGRSGRGLKAPTHLPVTAN